MQLTKFSDYALRVLIYVESAKDELVTIDQIASAYGISRAHLMKVVNTLTREGFLNAVRGRSGGLRLAKPPGEIRLGDVLRATEPDFAIVECFSTGSPCAITRCCRLSGVLQDALGGFLDVMDRHTLADIALGPRVLKKAIQTAD